MKHPKHANRYWGDRALPTAKSDFFNAITTPTAAGDGTVATVRMYGPIDSWGGYWGISAKDVGEVLDALPTSVEQIILRINSPGGEVWEAVSILNMLGAHRASVLAVVDGLAGSAGSFIAAGCDETVMSPGTQMMIHSPSTFSWGNARDLRKDAEVLDTIEKSIVEIYAAKAGEKDWAALLEAETWMTATETVALGLADRVATIPDAGEVATAGEDDEVAVIVLPDEEIEDAAAARVLRMYGARPAPTNKLPSSTEPGDPNRRELPVSDILQAGLRKRLGVTDAAATDEVLLAALDEALAEQPTASATPTALPAGAVAIDRSVLEQLQEQAAQGAQARAEQTTARRDGIIATAMAEGRISAAQRDGWRAQLDVNEEGTASLLSTLARGTSVHVDEVGHSDDVDTAENAQYNAVYGTPKEA